MAENDVVTRTLTIKSDNGVTIIEERTDTANKSPSSSIYSVQSTDDDPVDPKPLDPLAPTDEELLTLRRVPGRLPWTAYTLAFVEMCERLSFCGTVAVCA